jgi:hypothetical protein
MAHAAMDKISTKSQRVLERHMMQQELGHMPNANELANRIEDLRRKSVPLTPDGITAHFASMRAGRAAAISQSAAASGRSRLRR